MKKTREGDIDSNDISQVTISDKFGNNAADPVPVDETNAVAVVKPKCRAANMTTKSTGLVLNCYQLRRRMRDAMIRKRIRPASVVYLGAVMEYLMAEVLELAGNCARDMKMKTIMPRHVMMAVEMDDELKHIFDDFKVIMPGVGVVPGIHPCLAARTVDQDTFKGWSKQNLSMKAGSGSKD